MLIIATIGLNSFQEDKLRKIILSGADVLRYNLSYHIIDDRIESIGTARNVIENLNSSVKILIDLPTNKFRLGDFNERIFTVKEGEEITFRSASYSPDCREFVPIEMNRLGERSYINQMITIGDGEVAIQVTEIINTETMRARVLNNGIIKYTKTFNIDQRIDNELFLKYYKELLPQISQIEPDYLSIPFLDAQMNNEIKKMIEQYLPKTKIVIKIEKQLDKDGVNEIINDNRNAIVLLDRGELGVNEPYEKMGLIQRNVVSTMRLAKKPMWISTQILESTINNFIPSRADIANLTEIVMSGVDGIVFCHETTVGLRPSYTISVAKRIINEVKKHTEERAPYRPILQYHTKADVLVTQNMPSLTEWLEKIQSPGVAEFRNEDIMKYQRLEVLKKHINIPYDKPDYFEAEEVFNYSQRWQDFIKTRQGENCVIKLIPKDPQMPKYRSIGKTLSEYNNEWIPKQKKQIMNPQQYQIEILWHNFEMKGSSIFLINDFGVWGDMVEGVQWQLAQGISGRSPLTFYYDFQNLWFYDEEKRKIDDYKYLIMSAIKQLLVIKPQIQYSLEAELQSEFTIHGYLKGYFEFCYWPERGIIFNDYNRIIYRKLSDLRLCITHKDADLKGLCANPGKTTGLARVISDPKTETFNAGEILICKSINLDYLPFMTKSNGIITEQGNILSHLAIISRELKKPCIVSVKNITKRIRSGDKIRLDADKGIIEIIEMNAES